MIHAHMFKAIEPILDGESFNEFGHKLREFLGGNCPGYRAEEEKK